MSDEIDIEEHDVLENPTIREIFPDLSIIKQEISQYEEGLKNTIEETTPEAVRASETDLELKNNEAGAFETCMADDSNAEENTKTKNEDTKLEVRLRFKTFLDSLADDVFDNNDCQSHIFSDVIPSSAINVIEPVQNANKKHRKPSNNSFILGSKPNLVHSGIKIKEKKQLKIALNNVGPYLKENKQYCKHCSILFPNVDALNCHMNKIHALRTKDSSKTKNNQNKQKVINVKPQCGICYIQMHSKGNLVRHIKTVHKHDESIKSIKVLNRPKRLSKPNRKYFETKRSSLNDANSAETNNCFHCHKQFESQTALIDHLYDVLNPNQNGSNDVTKNKGADNSGCIVNKDGDNVNNTERNTCVPNDLPQSETDNNKIEMYWNMNSSSLNKNIDYDLQKAYSACKGLIQTNLIANIQNNSRLDELTENNKKSTVKQSYGIAEKCPVKQSDRIAKKNGESGSNSQNLINDESDASPERLAKDSEKPNKVHKLSASVINIKKKQFYQCYICSQYMKHWKWYSKHMNGHNIKDVLNADRVTFDAQCKFCYVKTSSDPKSYNNHISYLHREKTSKKIDLEENAFHSVLFKCLKCDVCFLTANASKKHSEHEAIFVDWKCLDCHKLFKMKDRAVHLKQHILSKNITTYALSGSALNRVLYKCLKCAVHFSEKEYFIHYATCDLVMPNSAYCNDCDILINKKDLPLHEVHHIDINLQIHDFTFIESDIINITKQQKTEDKQKIRTISKFALTYCFTCNCYLSNLGRMRKAHIEGRCGMIGHRLCAKCGLIFTSGGYLSHQGLHDKVKNLNLQSFYFYDIKTKKQIRPPVPKYSKCDACEVHFLSKKAIHEHLCTEERFTKCNSCKILLVEAAFKLHMKFHKYKLSCTALSKKVRKSFNAEKAISSTTNSTDSIAKPVVSSSLSKLTESWCSEVEEAVTSTTSSALNIISTQNPISSDADNTNMNTLSLSFTCILCEITVNTYDKAIEHCHDHYDFKDNLPRSKSVRSNDNCDENISDIEFDPFYIRFDKDIWLKHIFETLTDKEVADILENSKYKFESRLKMEEIQSGSDINLSPLYKCDICHSYVEPNALYAHAGTTCTFTSKHPCSVCGLCFASQSYGKFHEKTHENVNINTTSFKIILFNKRIHQQLTQVMLASCNKFILYQCRNCEVIIDRLHRERHRCNSGEILKCSYCELLFYDKDLKLHITKHELIKHFQSAKIIVIMFGKLGCKRQNIVKPSFNGTVYDFTFYKCTNCGVCLKATTNTHQHVCVSKSYESQCPKCYLCFLTQDLEEHLKLHENNLELVSDDFKSNIISFTSTTTVQDIIETPLSKKLKGSDNIGNGNNELNDNITQNIYKCSRCGLNFLEELDAKKHLQNCSPKIKVSKQNCFKCDLLFTPMELFKHLLQHHSNKKLRYKYNVIRVSDAAETKISD